MEPRVMHRANVECRTSDGRVLAVIEIIAPQTSDLVDNDEYPLVLYPADEARSNGEEPLQLRERGRYEYCLRPTPGAPRNLTLLEQRGIQPSRIEDEFNDRGLIETRDYCGRLTLVIIRRGDPALRPLAYGHVEVRSIKLGYRDHYRGMLSFIADKCAGLVLDCRAATRLGR